MRYALYKLRESTDTNFLPDPNSLVTSLKYCSAFVLISGGLLLDVKEQIRPGEFHLSRNATHSPVAHSLHTERHSITKQLSHFGRPTKLRDDFRILFEVLIHAAILNAVFR